jgi:hypothetical protein
VALILGVGLFPAEPLSLLRDAERSVLRTLAAAMRRVAELLASGGKPEDEWTLRAGYEIHQQLGALARARATARANVRIAPRRWRLRDAVHAEASRTAQLDLLANAVLGLVRAASTDLYGAQPVSAASQQQIAALGRAIESLANTSQPWPSGLREEVAALATSTIEHPPSPPAERGGVVASILRAAANDLARVIKTPAQSPP